MKHALDIVWARAEERSLPDLIGPFDSEGEAREWARLNTGAEDQVTVRELSYPYLRGTP